jgi:hypothetical protein
MFHDHLLKPETACLECLALSFLRPHHCLLSKISAKKRKRTQLPPKEIAVEVRHRELPNEQAFTHHGNAERYYNIGLQITNTSFENAEVKTLGNGYNKSRMYPNEVKIGSNLENACYRILRLSVSYLKPKDTNM